MALRHHKASAVQLRGTHRLGIDHLPKATGHCSTSWRRQSRAAGQGGSAHRPPLLKQEAVNRMQPEGIHEIRRAHRPAVIPQQRLALAVEWFELVMQKPV